MNEPTAIPSREPVTAGGAAAVLQNIIDLYFDPREAFGRITRKPRVVVPLLLLIVLMALGVSYWVSQVEDPAELTKIQLQLLGVWDAIPEEARAQQLSGAEAALERQRWAVPLFIGAITALLLPGVFWVVYRFFYAGEVTFRQSMAIVTWPSLAVNLITVPLNLVLMWIKDDWYIQFGEALLANPTLMFDRTEAAPGLWWLLFGLDLFSFWFIFLLAVGFGVAINRSTSSALWGILMPWALFVLARAGLMALFLPGAS